MRTRFVPPTVEEVNAFATERGLEFDAEHFVNSYGAKGWMIGKNPMKDWHLCVLKADREGWCKPKSAGGGWDPNDNTRF